MRKNITLKHFGLIIIGLLLFLGLPIAMIYFPPIAMIHFPPILCLLAITGGVMIFILGLLELRYAIPTAAMPPLVWLLAPLLLAKSQSPAKVFWRDLYTTVRYHIEDWFIYPFILLLLLFLIYVFVGIENDQVYKDIYKPRKSVWLVFGLVVLFLIWFVPSTMLNAQKKFDNLNVGLTFETRDAVEDMISSIGHINSSSNTGKEGYSVALSEQATALESLLNRLHTSIEADPALLESAVDKMIFAANEAGSQDLTKDSASTIAGNLDDLSAAATEAQSAARQLAFTAGIGNLSQSANKLQQQIEEKLLPQILTAKQKVEAVSAADETAVTDAVKAGQDALAILLQSVGTGAEPAQGSIAYDAKIINETALDMGVSSGFSAPIRDTTLRTITQMQVLVKEIQDQVKKYQSSSTEMYQQQEWRRNEINDKVRALELAAAAITFDSSTPMLMVALMFIVFLLMPWLLYILYILQKRDQIVNDRYDLLKDLKLLERFRTCSLLSKDPKIVGANKARESLQNTIPLEKNVYFEESVAYRKAYEFKQVNENFTRAQKKIIKRVADTEILTRQVFHSREYLIPLLILTALTLVGWYYIFFAAGTNGLVRFIEQGGGSAQLVDLLAQFTPFTMVFAGAWLFMTVMLTYRWVCDDLSAQSYFYASMRLVYGLLVGMVFLALFGKSGSWFWLSVAFFVGAFPLEFVDALWKFIKDWAGGKFYKKQANTIVKYFERPDWTSHQPLTILEDINVWTDTRFYLEGIQNVQELATVDLLRLAVRMPYDAQTLVDWVDQAVLRIHTKVLWHSGMSAIGIRSATDLFDNCFDDQDEPIPEKLARVVDAFNVAQLMSIGTGDPRFEVYNEAAGFKAAAQALGIQVNAVRKANENLNLTIETIMALTGALDELVTAVKATGKARDSVTEKISKLGDLQTLALLGTQKKVKGISIDEAAEKASAADTALKDVEKKLLASTSISQPELENVNKLVDLAITAADALKLIAGAAADEAMLTVLPLRLTKEILEVMLDSLERNPNIHHIRYYWKLHPKNDKKKKV